jgi:hypothetical protein
MGRSPQEAWKNLYKHFPEAYRKVIPAPAS